MTLRALTLVPLLVALALSAGCQRGKKPPRTEGSPASTEGLLPIERLDAPAVATAGEFFTVTVSGNKPDPAWRWTHNALATRSGTVEISVHGQRDPGAIAAQVLTPYEAPQRIRKLKPGTLTVIARGRNRSITRTVEVR